MVLSKALFIVIVIYKLTILIFYNALDRATRLSTNFLNMQSLHKNWQALKELFVGDVWHSHNKLSTSLVGHKNGRKHYVH